MLSLSATCRQASYDYKKNLIKMKRESSFTVCLEGGNFHGFDASNVVRADIITINVDASRQCVVICLVVTAEKKKKNR